MTIKEQNLCGRRADERAAPSDDHSNSRSLSLFLSFCGRGPAQVVVLDGVRIKKEQVKSAQDQFYTQLSAYAGSLEDIEESYHRSLREIDMQHQVMSEECLQSHCTVIDVVVFLPPLFVFIVEGVVFPSAGERNVRRSSRTLYFSGRRTSCRRS